jgi:hypothetical protein
MAMAAPASQSLVAFSSCYSSSCFFSPSRCGSFSSVLPLYSSSSSSSSSCYPYLQFHSARGVSSLGSRRQQQQQEQLWSRVWSSRAMSAAADVSPMTAESTVVSPHQSKNAFWVCLFRLGFVTSPAFGNCFIFFFDLRCQVHVTTLWVFPFFNEFRWLKLQDLSSRRSYPSQINATLVFWRKVSLISGTIGFLFLVFLYCLT